MLPRISVLYRRGRGSSGVLVKVAQQQLCLRAGFLREAVRSYGDCCDCEGRGLQAAETGLRRKKNQPARGTALVMVAASCREEEGGHSVHCSRSGSGYGSAALSCRWFLAAGRGSGRVRRLVPVGMV
ncbi:hypothetical protein NDU88_004535 [Pleurodeles waltl]|uniref:Uncharacterized protein n=1 Tax=Pleurodeles waltl TaxID=8319 RepID=A0AAV7KY12_PLEWA|nr:hypothetical protein NDU88_004535 [Pleurodeles waltl]